ncbi:hypothetical protein FHS55_002121 [Angulomicrobium tetraedrale]|uniref:Uncharacterized protein n=1 Tax=Ancylobacter tetraedralis TaxID=217068 RepID=A0A839Z9W6_9HYPH|nr:hypothetical protein [Ancylobacter tetraedralis]MBB3771522.1 hypothetical protein [Ancylobacter tetraedralis]
MSGNPYQGADPKMLAEVLREAESYLAAQLQCGLAADARAISFVSVIAAAAAIVAATGFTLLLQTDPSPFGRPALAIAGGFLIAMGLASYSARPVGFHYCGNTPSSWIEDIRRRVTLEDALAEQLQHYDDQILHNAAILRGNGRCMRAALIATWLSLFLGGAYALTLLP